MTLTDMEKDVKKFQPEIINYFDSRKNVVGRYIGGTYFRGFRHKLRK